LQVTISGRECTQEYVESIKPVHRPPVGFIDHAAYYSVSAVRILFDFFTGYGPKMTKDKWLTRCALI
jgi:Alternative oxidase